MALWPRLFDLDQFLTSDENTNIFLAGSEVVKAFLRGDLRQTYWHFYPGVTMSWADGLGMWGQWLLARITGATGQSLAAFVDSDIRTLLVATRLPYALLTALFVPAVYHLLRRWLSPGQHNPTVHYLALAAALLTAFDPFFLAHSRVVHGDAPVSVFMVLSALSLFVYLRDGSRKLLLFSAVMGSLAALTKAPGQFMAPFVVLLAAGDWALAAKKAGCWQWPLAKRRALDVLAWGLLALVTFIVMWPSMWVDPLGTMVQFLDETFGKVDEGHLVYFMGRPTLNPGLWFYVVVIPFRLTPVSSIGMLLSLGVLFVGTRRSPVEGRLRSLTALIWFFSLTLLLFGNISPKKQDRYLLPLFPMLDILAAIGWFGLWQWLVQAVRPAFYAARPKLSNATFLSVLVLAQIGLSIPWHPYYLAYFNPLLGGLARGVETTLVGWGEGMEQVAAYLNQKPNAAELYVASTPSQTLLPYFKGRGENFYTNDIALRADYVVIYRAQQQRLAPSPEIVAEYLAREPEKVINIKGVPYAWIYRNRPLILPDVPVEANLINIGFGEIMRLAGYQLTQRGDVLDVDLFWHALPPIEQDRGPCYEERVENFSATVCPRPDYAVSLRLISAEGVIVAQHDSWPANGLLPTSQWRVNDYVQDHHSLALPPEATPGDYTLAVVVYNAQSQAVLAGPIQITSFSLAE